MGSRSLNTSEAGTGTQYSALTEEGGCEPYHRRARAGVGRGIVVSARHQVWDAGERHWRTAVLCVGLCVDMLHLSERNSGWGEYEIDSGGDGIR